LEDYFVNNHFPHPQDYNGCESVDEPAEGVDEKQFWAAAVYFPEKARDGF